MRMDILYIYALKIIIKCDWTLSLNEAIHEIFVKHLKCIKMYRVYFDYIFLVSTEIIEYIVQRSPGIWND